jgi:hypothetical protein
MGYARLIMLRLQSRLWLSIHLNTLMPTLLTCNHRLAMLAGPTFLAIRARTLI